MPFVSGTVYDSTGSPVGGRTVRAYRRDTGTLLNSTVSGSGGGGTPYATEIATDSPALWFRSSESSGTVATNAGSLGASGVGTYTGTIALLQDGLVPGGYSAGYGGAAAAGRIVSADATNYGTACSLESVFVAGASGHGDLGALVGKATYYAAATTDFPISLVWRPDVSKVAFRIANGTGWAYTAELLSAVLATDVVVHAVGVYRISGLCELYINGTLADSITIASGLPAPSVPWTVGGLTPNSVGADASAFKGRISEAAVYSTALSSARIAAHADAIDTALGTYVLGTAGYAGELNVVCLDDAAGTTENDLIIRTTGV